MNTSINEKDVAKRFVRSFHKLAELEKIRTKKAFCEETGISSSSNFKKMEEGVRKPTVKQLCKLFVRFRVSPEWIFFEKGEFIKKDE